jgi:hypothetical protein
MRPYLERQAATGRSGVAAIGVAQEFASVFIGVQRDAPNGIPWFCFTKADRRVSCYFFYVWDDEFGPAFIKICAYFPYPAKIWLNGHEWAKRQVARAGIGFTALSSGFASTDEPGWLQATSDSPPGAGSRSWTSWSGSASSRARSSPSWTTSRCSRSCSGPWPEFRR